MLVKLRRMVKFCASLAEKKAVFMWHADLMQVLVDSLAAATVSGRVLQIMCSFSNP